MTMSPMLWGAGLACALGGAIAGNALGSTPILDRPTFGSFYQTHQGAEWHEVDEESPPDHYPLVTRDGVVPVGELSMRGLYSQRRYRALAYYTDFMPTEASIEEYPSDWDKRYAAFDDAGKIAEPSPSAAMPDASTDTAPAPAVPLQLAAGPASVSSEGNAKMVDVQATLAMR